MISKTLENLRDENAHLLKQLSDQRKEINILTSENRILKDQANIKDSEIKRLVALNDKDSGGGFL